MAELAAILPVVSRCSCLALELYQFAASSPGEAKDLVKVAKAINSFASILKQVGTIIKEDDRLPSYTVCHSLHVSLDTTISRLSEASGWICDTKVFFISILNQEEYSGKSWKGIFRPTETASDEPSFL